VLARHDAPGVRPSAGAGRFGGVFRDPGR
jgi:hypothetical protein